MKTFQSKSKSKQSPTKNVSCTTLNSLKSHHIEHSAPVGLAKILDHVTVNFSDDLFAQCELTSIFLQFVGDSGGNFVESFSSFQLAA
jgi:hypothetical protein